MITLTKENAHRASTIINKKNPEWGTKRFNFNSQGLHDGERASSFGMGSNSAILSECEYHFWEVVTSFTEEDAKKRNDYIDSVRAKKDKVERKEVSLLQYFSAVKKAA